MIRIKEDYHNVSQIISILTKSGEEVAVTIITTRAVYSLDGRDQSEKCEYILSESEFEMFIRQVPLLESK